MKKTLILLIIVLTVFSCKFLTEPELEEYLEQNQSSITITTNIIYSTNVSQPDLGIGMIIVEEYRPPYTFNATTVYGQQCYYASNVYAQRSNITRTYIGDDYNPAYWEEITYVISENGYHYMPAFSNYGSAIKFITFVDI